MAAASSDLELELDLDLDEIDDKEFAIPSLDGPLPTLESILNEDDNDSIVSEIESNLELDSNQAIDLTANDLLDSFEKSSMTSADSKGLKRSPNVGHSNGTKTNLAVGGSVVRHSVLKSLSAQLKSANTERINAGKPTALTVSSLYVAVGTSHGFVLIFDLKQIMRSCLRITEDSGAVSALAIKKDSSRLLCGYSRGGVSLWDLTSGELIKVFTELHSPCTTVLHLKFMSDDTFGALSDSSGSVFMLDFRRRDIDSQCIFTGSRGEVLVLESLQLPVPSKKEILNFKNVCLLSMATVTKVIALTLRPTIVVQFTHPLKGSPDTLPLLSWQFVMVQVSQDTRVIDPVLAFARQNNINFFQASYKSSSKILFTPLIQITVGYIIQSLNWLNSRTIVTIDGSEHLHVLDVRSEEELEVIDIDKIQMVFSSAIFKALDSELKVSEAMATSAKRACYHSACVSNATLLNNISANLLILGLNSVHSFAIRSWSERIDILLNNKQFLESLALTLSIYENTAKAVIGLMGKKSEKRKFVAQKMVEVINRYVDWEMSLCPQSGKVDQLKQFYRQVIFTSVDYCLAIEENHYLLTDLFERFSDDNIAKIQFLDALEPHVMKGFLKRLSPIVAKELITYYEEKEWFGNIETAVTHLDITSLDIHHVMTICQKKSLFDAIIYIHINAFDDYVSPFDQLIQKIRFALSVGPELSDQDINLGNKLILYISALLSGRSFPFDKELEPEKKSLVVKQIMPRIMSKSDPNLSSGSSSSQTVIYPNMKTLLHFDAKQFLNVMANAFEIMDTENSYLRDVRQQLVDILVTVMIEDKSLSDLQKGAILLFIAKLISTKRNEVFVNDRLLDQIFQYLFTADDSQWFEERQQILLEFIQSETGMSLDEQQLIEMARRAHFFKVCEYIYLKNRSWGQIIMCYIHDKKRENLVFDYIHQILLSTNVSEEEKKTFKDHIYSNIEFLTQIDNKMSAKLVFDVLDIERFDEIIASLEAKPNVLYKLLFGIIIDSTKRDHKRDASTGSISLESLSLNDQKKRTIISDPKLQDKFIELMAEFEPNRVFQTLHILEDYRPEIVLKVCQKHNITDATAYLLEKTSRFDEAFELLLNDLDQVIDELLESEDKSGWNVIRDKIVSLIGFCCRCSLDLSPVVETLFDRFHSEEFNFKDLLTIVYNNFNREETLLLTANDLLLSELHRHFADLCKDVNKAKANRSKRCGMCSKNIDSEPIVLFNCMHSFHQNCVAKQVNPPKCLLCHSSAEDSLQDMSSHILNLSHDSNQTESSQVMDSNERLRSALNLSDSQLKTLQTLRSAQRIDSKLRNNGIRVNTSEDLFKLNLAPNWRKLNIR